MVVKTNSILFFTLIAYSVFSQDVFVKTIDKEETRLAIQVAMYEDRIFILNTGVCENQYGCSLIMEIDYIGNVIWEKTMKWLDVGPKSMIVEDDIIYVSGNHPSGNRWLWHQMSASGGDSLTTYEIYEEDNIYINMFNLGQVKSEDQFCLYGPGRKDGKIVSLLYFINQEGELDTLLDLFETEYSSDPWEIIPDNEGNLVVFIRYREPGKDSQRIVAKIDNDKRIIWRYLSEEEDNNNFSVPNGAVLHDGTLVYNTVDVFNDDIEYLRAIKPDSTIAWIYESPDFDGYVRDFVKIKTLSDGSIIGTGIWGRKIGSPIFDEIPWLIKISVDGALIWERAFYKLIEGSNVALGGLFGDVVELDDGSLLAVGGMRSGSFTPLDILIARLDSEGCLTGYCPVLKNISGILTAAVEIKLQQVNFYPNPVADVLSIDEDEMPLKIAVYSMDGSELLEESNSKNINVSSLPKGMYILKVFLSKRIALHSFIKM